MEVIIEYENCLIGKNKTISQSFFPYDDYANEKIALRIMKYAFETYLGWDPFALRDHLTKDILKKLKLTQLIRYISFPPELNSKKDFFYIIWKLYPQTINFSENDLILKVYKNLLSGKIQRFPKEFFTGIYGLERARLCLQYMIEEYIQVSSIEELYELFSSENIITLLEKYKLRSICEDSFLDPLEFLHYSLPEKQKSEFLYNFYIFMRKKEAPIENNKTDRKE